MITVHKDIYNISTNPKTLLESKVSLSNAVIIFAMSMISFLVSILYIKNSNINIFMIITTSSILIGYFFIVILLKLSIIHTVASMSTKYKNGKSIQTLLSDTLSSTIVFLPILPIAFITNIIPFVGTSIYVIIIFVAFIMYVCSIYLIMLKTFEMSTNWHAILLIAMPFLCDILFFYLSTALFFTVLIESVSSLMV